MVDKSALRKVYLEKRMMLSDSEYERRNRMVHDHFLQLFSPHKFNELHVYLPISSKKEVNTWPIIRECRKHNPEMKIYTTKSLKNGQLEHYLLEKDTRLHVNPWGIPEPDGSSPVNLKHVDVILLPLIISDKDGNRIGYGKGYYDRFLEKVRANHLVGLSMSPPLDHIPYMQEHDIPLTACITPFITEFY